MMARTILVTGSSRGIGKAVALRLAREGYDIVVHYFRNREAAEQTRAEIAALGVSVRILGFDVSNRAQCHEVLSLDLDQNDPYYGVVCNAGIAQDNAFPALSGAQWDAVLHTNLDGFYNVLHPVVMPMVRSRRPGRIVTISSVSGIAGNRGQVNYSAAKAGIIGATKALALELAKRLITVNCVAPGLIETEMLDNVPLEDALRLIPLRRLGRAEEVAELINFLMSDGAGYITRQVISINGGLV